MKDPNHRPLPMEYLKGQSLAPPFHLIICSILVMSLVAMESHSIAMLMTHSPVIITMIFIFNIPITCFDELKEWMMRNVLQLSSSKIDALTLNLILKPVLTTCARFHSTISEILPNSVQASLWEMLKLLRALVSSRLDFSAMHFAWGNCSPCRTVQHGSWRECRNMNKIIHLKKKKIITIIS